MDKQMPRDDDPSDMTDFEKNTAFEERERLEQDREDSDANRIRPERKEHGPTEQPGFGQGPVR